MSLGLRSRLDDSSDKSVNLRKNSLMSAARSPSHLNASRMWSVMTDYFSALVV